MPQESTTKFSLKDHLFNRQKVKYLAERLQMGMGNFDEQRFVREVMKPLASLELKQRIAHIAEVLQGHLDSDFKIASKQIIGALPPPLDPTKTDDDFGDFIFAPFGEYVVQNGMSKQHLVVALKTIKELTKRFSMEYAIRFFIESYPEKTLAKLHKWSRDRNYHVRRLVSEGTRPLLPWAGRLSLKVDVPLPLLHQLHADKTRFVTRSVANHLNDISKSNSTLVLEVLRDWKSQRKQEGTELDWMCRHALRTLVKKGDAAALEFLGFTSDTKVKASGLQLNPAKVKPGQRLQFEFELSADRDERLVVDYVIDFVKSNGKTAGKVFKLKQLQLQKGQTVRLKKNHGFVANATTYTLYPGVHQLTIQINGQPKATAKFELL